MNHTEIATINMQLDTEKGEILLDGVNIKELSEEELRKAEPVTFFLEKNSLTEI